MNEYNEAGRRVRLNIWYPVLPPTSNKIYFKGTRLTDAARTYREQFRQYVQQYYGHQLTELVEPNDKVADPNSGKLIDFRTRDPNLIFQLDLYFYMDWRTSWSDDTVPPSRKARFRFAKVDLSNRIKLLEDCFKYATDIDDSLTFASTQRKVQADQEGVMLDYYVVPVESFGFTRLPGGS